MFLLAFKFTLSEDQNIFQWRSYLLSKSWWWETWNEWWCPLPLSVKTSKCFPNPPNMASTCSHHVPLEYALCALIGPLYPLLPMLSFQPYPIRIFYLDISFILLCFRFNYLLAFYLPRAIWRLMRQAFVHSKPMHALFISSDYHRTILPPEKRYWIISFRE